ncbi:hypothetical protein U9M48_030724 [Paspalum notatum var. saurae]|uniref:Uncharacterized protein n=1 Tax=Paspalum notatum var. saurae TaxID=547442 RepID=A0AAQ3X2K2_PASNO
MHIDPANEELPQEQPLIEEPEDEQVENPQPNSECIVEDANPNEEGTEFLFCACVGGGPCHHQEWEGS